MKILTELTDDEAQALAQFLKRITLETALKHSVVNQKTDGTDEAYLMLAGLEKVREALAKNGFAPH